MAGIFRVMASVHLKKILGDLPEQLVLRSSLLRKRSALLRQPFDLQSIFNRARIQLLELLLLKLNALTATLDVQTEFGKLFTQLLQLLLQVKNLIVTAV